MFNDDVMGADRATDHVSMDKFSENLSMLTGLDQWILGAWPLDEGKGSTPNLKS